MDKLQLAAIAKEFGTPSFVFDESALACRMREISKSMNGCVYVASSSQWGGHVDTAIH